METEKHENSRFLTYVNLNTILRYFYAEVLEGMYGYHIAGYGEVTDYDAKTSSAFISGTADISR